MEFYEKPVSQEYIYRGKVVTLRRDVAAFPDGKECLREVIEHRGAVAVVVLDDEEIIYLVGDELMKDIDVVIAVEASY